MRSWLLALLLLAIPAGRAAAQDAPLVVALSQTAVEVTTGFTTPEAPDLQASATAIAAQVVRILADAEPSEPADEAPAEKPRGAGAGGAAPAPKRS